MPEVTPGGGGELLKKILLNDCLNSLWWDNICGDNKSGQENPQLNQWLPRDVKYGFLTLSSSVVHTMYQLIYLSHSMQVLHVYHNFRLYYRCSIEVQFLSHFFEGFLKQFYFPQTDCRSFFFLKKILAGQPLSFQLVQWNHVCMQLQHIFLPNPCA